MSRKSRGVLYSILNFDFKVVAYRVDTPDTVKEVEKTVQAKNLLEATTLLNKWLVGRGMRKYAELTVSAWKPSAIPGKKLPVDISAVEREMILSEQKRLELISFLEESSDKAVIETQLRHQNLMEEAEQKYEVRRRHVQRRKTSILSEISKKYGLKP